MARRWLGGVFGNTVGSDTNVSNTTGVFAMEQQYYMKQEGGWELPPLGTQFNPLLVLLIWLLMGRQQMDITGSKEPTYW